MSSSAPAAESRQKTRDELNSQVMRVLERYLADLERGAQPHPDELLAQHPELAEPLRAYLASLEFLHRAAVSLRSSEQPQSAGRTSGDFPLPGLLGDFRIVREIGRGGMGIVYEAEQISIGRRVALKVLPFAAMMDPRQLQRFKNEVHAAGQLHHTNIVPVFAVGCERGVHFYAMQFIAGQTLAEVIRELRRTSGLDQDKVNGDRVIGEQVSGAPALAPSDRPQITNHRSPSSTSPLAALSTERSSKSGEFYRTVARLGIQAAEALDHAHQVGIIHRDVKPSNLLLDERGNLWITDFGLARILSPPSEGVRGGDLTLTGDILGTLRYMSPEQALAKRAVVDHRTDIYSLGVTLYEMLTLEPAFGGHERPELLRQIAEDDPPPPRRLNSTMPTELETIVLKTLAKNPDARYSTAQDLADDLERFLDDKPILARRPTFAESAAKWSRRHRPVVVSAAALLVMAVLALTVSTVLIWRAGQRARRAYDAEAKQHARAEANWQMARRSVDEMYTQVAMKWLAHEPHMQDIQRDFLQKALEFYEQFAQRNTDLSLRADRASAYNRAADIERKLGHLDAARAAYEQAIALFSALANESPDEPGHARSAASCYQGLGLTLQDLGRYQEANQAFAEAFKLYEPLAANSPESPDVRKALAHNRFLAGNALMVAGRTAEAEALFRQALPSLEQLANEFPDVAGISESLAMLQNSLGIVFNKTNRLVEAEQAWSETVRIFATLADKFPDATDYREEQGVAHNNLGALFRSTGRPELAEDAYNRAIAIHAKLFRDFPSVTDYQWRLASFEMNLANLLGDMNRSDESEQSFQRALDELEKLVEGCPSAPDYRNELAKTYANRAIIRGNHGRYPETIEPYEKALFQYKQLTADFPAMQEYRSEAARYYMNLGAVQRQLVQRPQAEQAFTEAVAVLAALVNDFPDVSRYRHRLADSHKTLANLLKDVGQFERAQEAYGQSLVQFQKLADDEPALADYRRELANTHRKMADLRVQARLPNAEQSFRNAVEVGETLVTDLPAVPDRVEELAKNYIDFGDFLQQSQHVTQAEPAYDRAIELLTKLMAEFGSVREYRSLLAAAYNNRGVVMIMTGRAELAEQSWGQTLALYGKLHEDFPEVPKYRDDLVLLHCNLGMILSDGDRSGETIEHYNRALALKPDSAETLNCLAWFLATCSDAKLRDPVRAVQSAQRSVELAPQSGDNWSTLGAALCRAERWQEAIEALDKSMQLRDGGDSNDWFFLAIAHHHLDDSDKARQWFQRAVQWMQKNKPNDAELKRFRDEAAELLRQ